MPLAQPAMMLIVPVGAIVVVVALRSAGCPARCHREPGHAGKLPRRSASAIEAASDSRSRNPATRSASASAASES